MSKSDWPPHSVHGPRSTAHPYPLEIAFHATIFLTGAIFNDAFLDAAIGDYFQQVPDFYKRVHAMFIARGLDAYYCKLAMRRDWASNVVRVVTMPEVEKWHDALTDTIRLTSNAVAKTYLAVGPYSP